MAALRKDTNPEVTANPVANERQFTTANWEAKAHYGRFNLLIVGPAGVGKSSLVNAVFGRNLAQVGVGLPVTKGLTYYHDGGLGIWDSEGLELGTPGAVQRLRNDLAQIAQRPRNEQISVVWYCILAKSHRIVEEEIQLIHELARLGLPVIVVLTKVKWVKSPLKNEPTLEPDDQEFYDWLVARTEDAGPGNLPARAVIPTSTVGNKGKGMGHGLSELVSETLQLSPEGEKNAFRIAQSLNLPWKRELARKVTAAAAATAFAAAATPIPVTDAALLAPIQITMMGRIAAIYELDMKTMLSTGTLAQFSAQLAGQALARSFLKLLPGVGSVVNASVASGVTVAMGEGWTRLCEQVYTGRLDPREIDAHLKQFAPTIRAVMIAMAGRKLFKKRV